MPPPRSPGPSVLLIRDRRDRQRLLTRRCRAWDRIGARLLAASLDRRLAAGHPPEADRLTATRAQSLVSPGRRRALAANWEHLLDVARRQPLRSNGRMPLCRDRIAAAEPAVHAMLVALVTPLPVSARGVAMASLLLSDGAGPLYNRQSSADLVTAVDDVTVQLDPWASLVATA
ncbi:MAG TPA: hypothetical protein VN816_05255 [Acidimicrobiales bacterium]|nr:hypothetical protein [Acidimicrobiales bacterium]